MTESAANGNAPRLIAIGGGGFTHGSDAELDDFVIAHAAGARTRIGYLGAANADDPRRVARFYDRFGGVCASASHITCGASAQEVARWLEELDVAYVGGGDTFRLLRLWRTAGIDGVLMAAARRGLLLAGVSAGAVVWFESALSDAGGEGLRPVATFGLLPGSCCPHYSSEPERRPEFERRIGRDELPAGLAIDDGAAVLVDAAGPRLVCSARPGASAYRVRREGGGVVSERLSS